MQFFIRGDSAAGKRIGKEISDDPSFNQADFDTYEKIWQASADLTEWKQADEDDAVQVPEPGTLALLAAGGAAVGTIKYIQKKRSK